MTRASARTYWSIWSAAALVLLATGQPLAARAESVVFATNTTIDAGDTTYEGYDVTVRGCTVTINGAHSFASLLVENSGTVTHTAGYVPGMSLSITGNISIRLLSSLDVNACGYGADQGPGHGQIDTYGHGGGGASYGGEGTTAAYAGNGEVYGSVQEPTEPGSGSGSGASGTYPGGSGGGAVRLIVHGALQVDGRLTSNGQPVWGSGGGSGGSIYLTVGTLSGSGTISAYGGDSHNHNNVNYGGSGGGGRIAICYGVISFGGSLSARGGYSDNYGWAGAGTLYTRQSSQLYGDLVVDNAGNQGWWTPVIGHQVFDTVRVRGNGILGNRYPRVLDVECMMDMVVEPGGTVCADQQGHPSASGPGAGANGQTGYGGSGASYGGDGTMGATAGAGSPYGSVGTPVDLGSGGGMGSGTYPGGSGGGAVRLIVHGALQVDGRLTSNGQPVWGSGGGSGGSIYLTVGTLSGSGTISAYGGDSHNHNNVNYGGSGGGGRIAICYGVISFGGSLSARGGYSDNYGWAGAGTILLQHHAQAYGDLWVLNSGNAGGTTRLLDPAVFDNVSVILCGRLSSPPRQMLSLTTLGNVVVDRTSSIDISGGGHSAGQGPGAGETSNCGGGAHGGRGRQSGGAWSGTTYGSELAPSDYGSGGAQGAGGGAAHLIVNGTLQVEGSILSNGTASSWDWAGGGSGGSLLLRVGELAGHGQISADGAQVGSGGGGGGGGRVALYYGVNSFLGILRADGGWSNWNGQAENGTVHLEQTTADYTVALVLSTANLAGGQSTIGVLTLSKPAPDGGIAVHVQSSDASVVSVPPSVSFGPGETAVQFPVTAQSVTTPRAVTVTARLWDRTSTAQLTVNPWLSKLMVNPSAAASGDTVAGTLVLSTPAPDGGLLVALAADKPAALTVPTSVLVAPGQKVATFDMVAGSVTKTTTVSVSASYLAESRAATVYVNPAGAQIKAFVISPASVLGGQSAQGVITLTKRAPASGLNIALTSSDPSGVTVPTYVNIPGDRTSGFFEIITKAGLPAESVVVTATISGAGSGGKAQATLVIRATGIKSLVLSPATVYGGETAIGLVTLDSTPLAPVVVTVQSDQSLAVPQNSIVIPAGRTTGAFYIDTLPVSARVLATITARANGTQRSKRLTIDPEPGGKRRWRGAPW